MIDADDIVNTTTSYKTMSVRKKIGNEMNMKLPNLEFYFLITTNNHFSPSTDEIHSWVQDTVRTIHELLDEQ